MNNSQNNSNNNSATVFIVLAIILLAFGALFLYIQDEDPSVKPTTPVENSIEGDATVPIRNDADITQQ